MKQFPTGEEAIKRKLDGWYQHVDYEILYMWRTIYHGLVVYHIVTMRKGKLDHIIDFVRIFSDRRFARVELSLDGSSAV